jgi:hypothetical protein
MDSTLPAAYTRKLYGNLPRGRAYLLTQLRTGHNWLSTFRNAIGFRDDDHCACGAQETVTHAWDALRRVVRREPQGRIKKDTCRPTTRTVTKEAGRAPEDDTCAKRNSTDRESKIPLGDEGK